MSISRLDSAFEGPEFHKFNAQDRAPITGLLEDLFDRLIDVAQPRVTIEVGAFEADFSRRMRSRFPDAAVRAFEANPRVFEQYVDAARSSGVDYRHLAIGAQNGHAQIHIPTHIGDKDMPFVNRMGSLHVIQMRNSEVVSVQVPAQTLDEACGDIPSEPGVLWIDVEGAVEQVLAGAQATLSRCALLFCELELSQVWSGQALSEEVRKTLSEAGFVPVARDCQKNFQYNAIFLKADFLSKNSTAGVLIERYIDEALRLWAEITATPEPQ